MQIIGSAQVAQDQPGLFILRVPRIPIQYSANLRSSDAKIWIKAANSR
jgi:hypothetical protein